MKWSFYRSNSGVAAVEFAIYMVVFTVMCGFMMDMSFSIVKKSKYDRVNNSLLSILRERDTFFDGTDTISKNDLEKIKIVTDFLFKNSKGEIEPYQINIRSITYATTSTQVNKVPQELNYSSDKIGGCDISKNLTSQNRLNNLSAWGVLPSNKSTTQTTTWSPVYEVTLCVPGATSYFGKAMGVFNSKLNHLYIRNAAIPRL